jgi:hypothetical protein
MERPSAFKFAYSGASGSTANPPANNGLNEIYWAPSGFASSSTLAWNQYWYDGSGIVESDIVFNDAYTWGDASSDTGVYDIESVAIHEMGHSLSLDDQYGGGDSGKVMYGFGSAGHVHRALSTEDAKGITYIFRTDTVAPVASASVNGSTVSAGSTTAWLKAASVTLSANESATRYYNLDSTGQTTYASAFGVTPDGTHSLQYWAVDTAGNTGALNSITVRVDSAPPTTAASVAATYSDSASITIVPADTGGSGVAWTDYRLDSSTIASGPVATITALGAHTIEHRAVDNAGNVGAWSSPAQSFTVVESPPAAPTSVTRAASTPAPAILVSWTDNASNETGFVVERAENGGTFVQIATPAANATSYKDTLTGLTLAQQWGSTWSYRVKALNTGGSSAWATTSSGLKLDALAPTTSASVSSTYTTSASITIVPADTGGSGLAWTEYQLDSTVVRGTLATTSVLGTHTIRHRAADNAGNTGAWSTPQSFSVVAAPPVSLTPVWRFFNFKQGVHFFTASAAEMASVRDTLSKVYVLESVAYYLNTANSDNKTPLYRFFNFKQGVHFYTASEAEKNNVVATLSKVFVLESVAYNVCATNVAGATPVYRFFNFKKGVHFYTASEAERDNVIKTLSWTYSYEGIGYYLAP